MRWRKQVLSTAKREALKGNIENVETWGGTDAFLTLLYACCVRVSPSYQMNPGCEQTARKLEESFLKRVQSKAEQGIVGEYPAYPKVFIPLLVLGVFQEAQIKKYQLTGTRELQAQYGNNGLKEQVFTYLSGDDYVETHGIEVQLALLNSALDEETYLGKFFHYQRGNWNPKFWGSTVLYYIRMKQSACLQDLAQKVSNLRSELTVPPEVSPILSALKDTYNFEIEQQRKEAFQKLIETQALRLADIVIDWALNPDALSFLQTHFNVLRQLLLTLSLEAKEDVIILLNHLCFMWDIPNYCRHVFVCATPGLAKEYLNFLLNIAKHYDAQDHLLSWLDYYMHAVCDRFILFGALQQTECLTVEAFTRESQDVVRFLDDYVDFILHQFLKGAHRPFQSLKENGTFNWVAGQLSFIMGAMYGNPHLEWLGKSFDLKRKILTIIDSWHTQNVFQQQLFENMLNEDEPLGQIFHFQRGIFKPTQYSGVLREVATALERLGRRVKVSSLFIGDNPAYDPSSVAETEIPRAEREISSDESSDESETSSTEREIPTDEPSDERETPTGALGF